MSSLLRRTLVAAALALLVVSLPAAAQSGSIRTSATSGNSAAGLAIRGGYRAAPSGTAHPKSALSTDPKGGQNPTAAGAGPGGSGMSTDPNGGTSSTASPSGSGMTADPNG
jgi:hypothetical protein